MRRAIVPLALILALATGAVAAETRLLLFAPIGATIDLPVATANAATVGRFYDAANRAIASGETDQLGRLIDADLVEHTDRPGVTAARAGLIRYLQAVHTTAPTIRLQATVVAAQGDLVAALVTVEGQPEDPSTALPTATGRAWGSIDVFRLWSDRIVEHWGASDGLSLVEPLLHAALPVGEPTIKYVVVERQTYAGEKAASHTTGGPTILLIEEGTLTVALDGAAADPATIIGADGVRRTLLPAASVTLAAGDALVLTGGTSYAVWNDRDTSARVITLRTAAATVTTGVSPADLGGMPQSRPAGWTGPAVPPPQFTALPADGAVEFPVGSAAVTIGRIALAPGAGLERHRVANAELVVVDAGRLGVTVDAGKAWLRNAGNYALEVEGETALTAGAALLLAGGATVAYHSAGNEPVELVVVTIGPDPAGR
jgi:predicted SnoaL-like aldol condensation-catalyzing enzyme